MELCETRSKMNLKKKVSLCVNSICYTKKLYSTNDQKLTIINLILTIIIIIILIIKSFKHIIIINSNFYCFIFFLYHKLKIDTKLTVIIVYALMLLFTTIQVNAVIKSSVFILSSTNEIIV